MKHLLKNTLQSFALVGVAVSTLALSACSGETSNNIDSNVSVQKSAEFQVAHVNASEAYALLSENPNTVILDVRSPKEIEGGHIEGAVFANFFDEDFEAQLTKLNRDTPYIVHCKGGGRSTKALTTLEKLGFTNVTHMDGGLDGWKREELPLSKS